MCYGEQPQAELLLESINGSLVAIVVIDDTSAIPGWDGQEEEGYDDFITDNSSENAENASNQIHRPLIIRTPTSDLPYFNPLNTIVISPTGSHCIGLALIRGIDFSTYSTSIRGVLHITNPSSQPASDFRSSLLFRPLSLRK